MFGSGPARDRAAGGLQSGDGGAATLGITGFEHHQIRRERDLRLDRAAVAGSPMSSTASMPDRAGARTAIGGQFQHAGAGTDQHAQRIPSGWWRQFGPAGHRGRKQYFHRQACLNRSIAIAGPSPTLAGRRRLPSHGRVKPDGQRTAALQRFTVAWPASCFLDRACGSVHAAQPSDRIREMYPIRRLVEQSHLRCVRPADTPMLPRTNLTWLPSVPMPLMPDGLPSPVTLVWCS